MANRLFGLGIDLQQNPLVGAVADPQATGGLPAAPVEGQIAYDTTIHKQVVWNGTVWLPSGSPDATAAVKGIVQLAGDLGGTAAAPTVEDLHPVADVSMGGFKLMNVLNPTSVQDAATKDYVDNIAISGMSWKAPVRLFAQTALVAVTYANGASGVGATLTANANGVMANVDGVAPVAGDRILVAGQGSSLQRGIYVVTSIGAAGAPFVLTRAADANVAAELLNATVLAEEGTLYADTLWTGTANDPITVGTTGLPFVNIQSGTAVVGDNQYIARTGNVMAPVYTEWEAAAGANGSITLNVERLARVQRATIKGNGVMAQFSMPCGNNSPLVQGRIANSGIPWLPIKLDWRVTSGNLIIDFPVAPPAGEVYFITVVS